VKSAQSWLVEHCVVRNERNTDEISCNTESSESLAEVVSHKSVHAAQSAASAIPSALSFTACDGAEPGAASADCTW